MVSLQEILNETQTETVPEEAENRKMSRKRYDKVEVHNLRKETSQNIYS